MAKRKVSKGVEEMLAATPPGSPASEDSNTAAAKPARPSRTSVALGAYSNSDASRSAKSYEQMKAQIKELVELQGSFLKTMPVTKLEVRLRLEAIDPELVDISPENERDQGLLDEAAVSDILPLIKKTGQTQPGLVRPKGEGRYELIEGSRRRFCAAHLGRPFLAYVGEIPDADVRVLSRSENTNKPPSDYEKALSFERDINAGMYSSWDQLAAAEELSPATVSRYKALIEIDRRFILAFPDPSGLSANSASWLRKSINAGGGEVGKALLSEAERLAAEKAKRSEEGEGLLTSEEVMAAFKRVAREANAESSAKPTAREPLVYKDKSGDKKIKHSITRDGKSVKLELTGIDDGDLDRIVKEAKRIAGVS